MSMILLAPRFDADQLVSDVTSVEGNVATIQRISQTQDAHLPLFTADK